MEFFSECILLSILVLLVMKKIFDNFAKKYEHIPHDKIIPFFGHSLSYAFKSPSEILKIAMSKMNRLGPTALLLIGFRANVVLNDPKDIAELLSNRELIKKSDVYSFMKDWLGNGLLLSDGKKWSERRKILTPAFHFKILEDFIDIFDKDSSILLESLKNFEGTAFDVFPQVASYTLDVMCRTSMGISIREQNESNKQYVEAVKWY